MERLTAKAEEWDNTGLLAGERSWALRRVLVTVDLTGAVLEEAVALRTNAVVAYHPPIFKPIKSMELNPLYAEGIAAAALAKKISIYSPHTALDAAVGGTNDAIVAMLDVEKSLPFRFTSKSSTRFCKFCVFVPAAAVDAVASAMFKAGAGDIGEYEQCSFRIAGQGTFFGTDTTNPKVGRRGRLERVDEVRLEAVAPRFAIPSISQAIRRSHPYEEPAFDVYPLMDEPSMQEGPGRIGLLKKHVSLGRLAGELVRRTHAANACIVGDGNAVIRRIFVCVGAAGSLPFEIDCTGCGQGDAVITGEIRHHDALRYLRMGASAIALGHWASERPGVAALAKRLQKEMPGVDVRLSRADRDPFSAV